MGRSQHPCAFIQDYSFCTLVFYPIFCFIYPPPPPIQRLSVLAFSEIKLPVICQRSGDPDFHQSFFSCFSYQSQSGTQKLLVIVCFLSFSIVLRLSFLGGLLNPAFQEMSFIVLVSFPFPFFAQPFNSKQKKSFFSQIRDLRDSKSRHVYV